MDWKQIGKGLLYGTAAIGTIAGITQLCKGSSASDNSCFCRFNDYEKSMSEADEEYIEALKAYKESLKNSSSSTDNKKSNNIEDYISTLEDRLEQIKSMKPRKRDYRDYDGKLDREAYKEAKQEWEEIRSEIKSELKDLKKQLKQTSTQNTTPVSTSQNTQNQASSQQQNAPVQKNTPEYNIDLNNPIGSGEYVPDGSTKAEDALGENVLSKNAVTLSKDEQLDILKKIGLDNVDSLEACEGQDGTYSFKDGNKYVRIVKDNNEIKLINTTIENSKASTKVYKITIPKPDNNVQTQANTTSNSVSSSNNSNETNSNVVKTSAQDTEIEEAKKRLELRKIELEIERLEEKRLEEKYKKRQKYEKEESWFEKTTKQIKETDKFVKSIRDLSNSLRRLVKPKSSNW